MEYGVAWQSRGKVDPCRGMPFPERPTSKRGTQRNPTSSRSMSIGGPGLFTTRKPWMVWPCRTMFGLKTRVTVRVWFDWVILPHEVNTRNTLTRKSHRRRLTISAIEPQDNPGGGSDLPVTGCTDGVALNVLGGAHITRYRAVGADRASVADLVTPTTNDCPFSSQRRRIQMCSGLG